MEPVLPLVEAESAAYAAGIIDSDGSIALWEGSTGAGKPKGYQAYVGLGQVKPYTPQWFHETFGGSLHESGDGRVFQWAVHGPEAKAFLEVVLPYLRAKREQAELVLEYLSTVRRNYGRKRVPPDLRVHRMVLARKVSRLNRAPARKPDLDRPVALVEKFTSIQGEGANAGRPASFIRLAGCNLSCVFSDGSICDTPWRHTNEKRTVGELREWLLTQTDLTLSRLADRRQHRHMVILTGGEPTMSPAFDDLVHMARGLGLYVAVETNGTIWRDALRVCDWVVVSPKDAVAHDRPLHKPREGAPVGAVDPQVQDLFPDEYRFVVGGLSDVEPPYLPALRHYVSPALLADGTGTEWQDPGYQPRFAPGAVERCIEIVQQDPRWRLSLQTHKWLRVR